MLMGWRKTTHYLHKAAFLFLRCQKMDREPLLVALAVVVVIFIYSQQSPRKRKCSHRAPFNRHYKRRFIAACPGESGPRVILPHDFDFLNDVEFKQKYKYQKKTFVKLILLLDQLG